MDHCNTSKSEPSIPQLALDSSLASGLHLTTIDDEGVAGFTGCSWIKAEKLTIWVSLSVCWRERGWEICCPVRSTHCARFGWNLIRFLRWSKRLTSSVELNERTSRRCDHSSRLQSLTCFPPPHAFHRTFSLSLSLHHAFFFYSAGCRTRLDAARAAFSSHLRNSMDS